MMDLTTRLFLAAHDEWEISAESRELARDALAEIERLRARVVDAEAEASRWGDAIVAIGEAVGVHGGSTAEVVAAVQRAVTL